MTDKVQKIKEWISKEQDGLMNAQGNFEYPEHEGAYHILCNLDAYIDSLQEEPVSEKKCMFTKDSYTDEDRKVLCEDCGEKCEYSKKEEPVSDDLEEEIKDFFEERETWDSESQPSKEDIARHFANWQKQQDKRPISDNLEEEIDYLSKRYPEVSFAKLTRIAVHVAKWQRQQIFKVEEDAKLWARDYEDDFEDEFSKVLAERKEMLPKSEERFSDLDLYRVALHFNGWKEQQMMKDAVPGRILVNRFGNKVVSSWPDIQQLELLHTYDKVKLIIIKQEGGIEL